MVQKQLFKNSLFGIVQFILTSVLTLISVPIFIQKLGLELYGIFAIVSIVSNINLLGNFGLNGALLVYLAKQGKCRESDYDIFVTQLLMIVLLVVFSAFALSLSNYVILNIFSIPNEHFIEAKKLYYYLVFASSFLLIGQTYSAIIDAKQKMQITSFCLFIYSLLYWGGIIITVSCGGQLGMVGLICLSSAIIWFLLVLLFSQRVWGRLEINGVFKHFRRIANKQLTYGIKIYIAGLAGFMFEPFSKILLSNFTGLNSVALFEIGSKIKGQISGLFSKAFYPLLPFIANSQDNQSLREKIFDFSKKIQLFVIPLSITLFFILSILTHLWLGTNNYNAEIFTVVLTVSMLMFSTPIIPIYHYLAAKNKADKNIIIQLSAVIINTCVFLIFYDKLGLFTILLSNTLAYFTSFCIGNFYNYKYLKADFRKEMPYYFKLLMFSFMCTIMCLSIRHYLVPRSPWDLLIYPFLVAISFIIFIKKQKLISLNDMENYFAISPLLKKKLTRLLDI